MKKSHSLIAVCVLFLFWSFIPQAAALDFGVRGYLHYSALRGDMSSTAAGVVGTELNFKDQLSLAEVYYPSVEAFFGVGKHNLSLTYTHFDSSSTTTLLQAVQFKGLNFTPGPLQVDMKLRMLDFEYQYNLLQIKALLAGLKFGFIGKIKYIEAEAGLKSATLSAKDSFAVPIPMVGVGASLGILLNLLEARAKITGIGYGDNLLYEAMADLSLTPFPFLDIHAGYKVTGLKVDQSDYKLKSTFAGPYVALTLGF